MTSLPLVSMSVVVYNQERFVRESIRSALAQTYEPLEIVVVDDCSSDGSFRIMQEEVAAYQGPHQVFLSRNDRNKGIVGNFNEVWSRCRGDIVVVHCGDDRSMPHRVATIVDMMERAPMVDYLYSDVLAINEDGDAAGDEARRWLSWPTHHSLEAFVATGAWGGFLGCSAAFRRTILTRFGPLRSDVLAEDCIMPFRAALGAGIRFTADQLVEYRIHPNMWSSLKQDSPDREVQRFLARGRLGNIEEWYRCLALSDKDDARLRRRLSRFRAARRFDAAAYDVSRLRCCVLAAEAIVRGGAPRMVLGAARRHLLRRW